MSFVISNHNQNTGDDRYRQWRMTASPIKNHKSLFSLIVVIIQGWRTFATLVSLFSFYLWRDDNETAVSLSFLKFHHFEKHLS